MKKIFSAHLLSHAQRFLTTTIMATAPISAAQAVGEYLQSPDDLSKISTFRKKLEKEKASIDVRLRNGVREQLQATRDGLRKLFGTRDNVQIVKDEMLAIEKACNDPHIDVPTFDQISRVRPHSISNICEAGSISKQV